MDTARFRLAAGACAYLTVAVPVGAYVLSGRLVTTIAALAVWGMLSPCAFAAWTVLRLATQSRQEPVPPLPPEEGAPSAAREAGP